MNQVPFQTVSVPKDWDRKGLPAWAYRSEALFALEREDVFPAGDIALAGAAAARAPSATANPETGAFITPSNLASSSSRLGIEASACTPDLSSTLPA